MTRRPSWIKIMEMKAVLTAAQGLEVKYGDAEGGEEYAGVSEVY